MKIRDKPPRTRVGHEIDCLSLEKGYHWLGLLILLCSLASFLFAQPTFPLDGSDRVSNMNLADFSHVRSDADNALVPRPMELYGSRLVPEVQVRDVQFFEDLAVILEYHSIWDVHSPDDPELDMRQQQGYFFTDIILRDLAAVVDPSSYDFVLLYSVEELPGWINSGTRARGSPAKNIGLPNWTYGQSEYFAGWTRLRSVPHMNSLEFVDMFLGLPQYAGGSLHAFHEMAHFWLVFWNEQSPGPRGWRPGDPVAWLAGASAHWSWNWVGEGLPGIMYSGPTSREFNDFDLYGIGLLPFRKAKRERYRVWECADPPTCSSPGEVHQVGLKDLLFSLKLRGEDYYSGKGRRVPRKDKSVRNLNVLTVVVKGRRQKFRNQQDLLRRVVLSLPCNWRVATSGKSKMTVGVGRPIDCQEARDRLEQAGE